jgi:hypothetical protein
MSFADTLRKELDNKNQNIIATEFEPRKEEIMETIAKGIRRVGFVTIDTFNNTGTSEGDSLGINYKNIEAFAEFLKAEGFKVSRCWWGYSSDGVPDMLKIHV